MFISNKHFWHDLSEVSLRPKQLCFFLYSNDVVSIIAKLAEPLVAATLSVFVCPLFRVKPIRSRIIPQCTSGRGSERWKIYNGPCLHKQYTIAWSTITVSAQFYLQFSSHSNLIHMEKMYVKNVQIRVTVNVTDSNNFNLTNYAVVSTRFTCVT
jgi:hypothetical protein